MYNIFPHIALFLKTLLLLQLANILISLIDFPLFNNADISHYLRQEVLLPRQQLLLLHEYFL